MKDNKLPEINFRHRLPVQIRFNDIDMFGHLNNSIYLQFLDMGKYAYFRQFMTDTFGSEPTAPVVANINCDFIEPTKIDERLEVLTAITNIADSSMVLDQRIVSSTGRVKCSARTIMVNIDLTTTRPVTVSDLWRKRINDYESGTAE